MAIFLNINTDIHFEQMFAPWQVSVRLHHNLSKNPLLKRVFGVSGTIIWAFFGRFSPH